MASRVDLSNRFLKRSRLPANDWTHNACLPTADGHAAGRPSSPRRHGSWRAVTCARWPTPRGGRRKSGWRTGSPPPSASSAGRSAGRTSSTRPTVTASSDSQRMGLEVFKGIPVEAPLIVAEAVWQYSHHVLAGLRTHRGPILTVANFDGQWPGLVGLLGPQRRPDEDGPRVQHASGPSTAPTSGSATGARVAADRPHRARRVARARPAAPGRRRRRRSSARRSPPSCRRTRRSSASSTRAAWACTTRSSTTSCSTRSASTRSGCRRARSRPRCQRVSDDEAAAIREWLAAKGMTFKLGTDEATELTEAQLSWQCKMYIAALRICDDFGLDAVGIQYQQGLKDLAAAQRPGRGPAQQRRPARRSPAATAAGSCSRTGRPCRTSTRSTKAWPSTR